MGSRMIAKSVQSTPAHYNLQAYSTVILGADGSGQVALGPSETAGPARWHVTGVIVRTNRPGQAPVPRAEVYLDQPTAAGAQGLTYDGSFAQGRTDLTIGRGQHLIVQWIGGKAGDVASLTLTGKKW